MYKRQLQHLDLGSGIVEAIVPFEPDARVYAFRRSGFDERSSSGQVEQVLSSQGYVVEEIASVAAVSNQQLLVESLMVVPDDVLRGSRLPGLCRTVDGSIVLVSSARADREEYEALLDLVYAVPGGLGVLCAEGPSQPRKHIPGDLDEMVARASQVLLGAYDGEGVLSWRRGPSR